MCPLLLASITALLRLMRRVLGLNLDLIYRNFSIGIPSIQV
jgi:hypothetical protein